MASEIDLANELYIRLRAGRAADAAALLHPQFKATLSTGMPAGIGRDYDGPDDMLHGVYERVGDLYDLGPDVKEMIGPVDGRVVVLGAYVGKARATGRPINAGFVHILRFKDGAISELIQVTDTAGWRKALGELSDDPAPAAT